MINIFRITLSRPLAEYLNRLFYFKFKNSPTYKNYPHFFHELINSSCYLFAVFLKAYVVYYLCKISFHYHRYWSFNYSTPPTLGDSRGSNMNAPLFPPLAQPYYLSEVFLIEI
jgi:hypothetical protein